MEDPPEKVGFADNHWVRVEGRAVAEAIDDIIYLVIALRNVGNGLAVLDRWDVHADRQAGGSAHRDRELFRRLTRDIYVPAGSVGFWQGAFATRPSPRSRRCATPSADADR